MTALSLLLYAAGGFAVVLGVLHFSFPRRFGFLNVLAGDEPEVPTFRLGFYRHDLKRSDLRGIVYVMNHCVSYAIVARVCSTCSTRAGWEPFQARWPRVWLLASGSRGREHSFIWAVDEGTGWWFHFSRAWAYCN